MLKQKLSESLPEKYWKLVENVDPSDVKTILSKISLDAEIPMLINENDDKYDITKK